MPTNIIEEPCIHVGIVADTTVSIIFDGVYLRGSREVRGEQTFSYADGIMWDGKVYDELLFAPHDEATDTFVLPEVTIGIGFHWQQRERQQFRGGVRLIVCEGKIQVINHVRAEEYLRSVISSEMRATSSIELLKAHAIISRSWLLAQIAKRTRIAADTTAYHPSEAHEGETLRWYDREEHALFDVCADDHCQRYQGITRATTEAVNKAIDATYGIVLCHNGKIADARFSKCCGGVTEEFENCWENIRHPYLTAVRDDRTEGLPDLRREDEATRWILSAPPAFCHTDNPAILSQVLNEYDLHTHHFFRWEVSYRQDELSELVHRKSGIDFGLITDLQPVERGTSGRIVRLRITGSRTSMMVGKELEIRRWLSESHLYSSAFVVRKHTTDGTLHFVLHGAGWGHGVGLCQIGAAVMSAQGYRHDEILSHYFKGTTLTRLYAAVRHDNPTPLQPRHP